MNFQKTIAVVQARVGSTRFPNKVLQNICGKPLIELLLERLKQAELIDKIIVAIPLGDKDLDLANHVNKLGCTVFRGSENDVLDRYYCAAKSHNSDTVVRITGDCPLIDPELVDQVIKEYRATKSDYVSNTSPPTYPDGLDIEVFSFAALETAWLEATTKFDREHVTPYIREKSKFKKSNVFHGEDISNERWTVDEQDDFDVVSKIFEHFNPDINFSWLHVLNLRQSHPELFITNQHLVRNEGADMGKGQKLWKRAKRVIPGGNMLLSKRSEMYLPDGWPSYFSKSKGCRVWDLDDREYVDMSFMSLGTNTLGYGHPEVDAEVSKTVHFGNMSTLNCPEEVYLAERLVELHPWADMVRFARTGGEANAIAIRIARAASGKDKVAFCGYHGWHDWYLAANIHTDANLTDHLLPGLAPNGVPADLIGSVLPFSYNRFDELLDLVENNDIGVIKMEVSRNFEPESDFLKKVRALSTEKNIVLVFDECTSGFRQSYGGLHKVYGVEPDMAVFGKALGNGYAITAVIGRRDVMEAAQDTFISSTFWTERIGPTAGLKTLDVMGQIKSWDIITKIGLDINDKWRTLAKSHDLEIVISGLPALTSFSIKSEKFLEYKTLITQEMLAKGYLATTSVFTCIEHTYEIVDGYFDALDGVFKLIDECEKGRDVYELLKGPVCHSGFGRLN